MSTFHRDLEESDPKPASTAGGGSGDDPPPGKGVRLGTLVWVPDAEMLGRIVAVKKHGYVILLANGVYVEVAFGVPRPPTMVWRRG